ncbi:MAG TPA: MFS transporter [Candidatus Methylomirabilis sp.]|nr:MFS transporter [Candidatus Methylomirabilis sp.]
MATMLMFLNYTAILPILQSDWGMRHGQAGLIFSAYQACYLLAVLVLASLTDRMDTRVIYLASAAWAGLAGLAFPLFAQDFLSAAVLRALAGIGLAGTYVPGMRLVADRFPSRHRGFAIAVYASAFGLGSAMSLALTGSLTRFAGWRFAMGVTALGPLLAAGLAAVVLSPAPPPPMRSARLLDARVFKNRPALLMIAGYCAHNWELFGMRSWIPPFLAAILVRRGTSVVEASSLAATLASGILLVGAGSNIVGGWLSDRWGRTRVIVLSQFTSAACSLAIGWFFAAPFWMILAVAATYGIFVTSESGALSTGVTELAEPSALGATLAVQSCLGFFAAGLAPTAVGFLLDQLQPITGGTAAASPWQWGPAFGILGLGVLFGPASMLALHRAQAAASAWPAEVVKPGQEDGRDPGDADAPE